MTRVDGPSPCNIGGIILQKQEIYTLSTFIGRDEDDILTATMNKQWLRALLLLLILSAVLAFTLALSPQTTAPVSPSLQKALNPHAPTATATPPDRSMPGSTDGLIIMSFAIAVIVVVPILLQKRLWKD